MLKNGTPNGSPWAKLSGPNLGYMLEMYDLYLESPELVEADLAELFKQYGARQQLLKMLSIFLRLNILMKTILEKSLQPCN